MARTKTTEQFIADAVAVHGDKYDYSKSIYTRASEKVCIICPEHGEFWQIAANHSNGQGCHTCGHIKKAMSRRGVSYNKRNWDFEQPDDYKLIPLTKGKFAMVDNEDFDRVKDINWSYSNGYACNTGAGRLHRIIMNAPNHLEVDHIHHNKLDNRKSELRLATHLQNSANQKYQNGSSKYKGVSWYKNYNKWGSKTMLNNKTYNLGYFTDEKEAAKAYDKKAIELKGEFAYQTLNFPELKEGYLKEIKSIK